jgi:hypothetical protein
MPSVHTCRQVLLCVESVADQLDHLEIRLDVFNTQLAAMRKDIATIEHRNNRLELETRNHKKLLHRLNAFLEALRLVPSAEAALATVEWSCPTSQRRSTMTALRAIACTGMSGFGERQTLVVTDVLHAYNGMGKGGFAVGPELERMLTAARTLAAALDTLDGVGMPLKVHGMRVVMDHKRQLSRLRDRFVGQAADFLTVRDSLWTLTALYLCI